MKEALHAAREAMKAMPQSAKALKLVGDVHASNSGGREKVNLQQIILSSFLFPLKDHFCISSKGVIISKHTVDEKSQSNLNWNRQKSFMNRH